jgi:hypothetical protein
MQNRNIISKKILKTLSLALCASMVAAIGAVSVRADEGDSLKPPSVPHDIRVPDEAKLFLVGHGVGTQNYVCGPSGSGFAFTLFTPEATLFTDDDKQLTTHFFSPNPVENGTIRATWEHSRDTSTVWGKVVGQVTVRADSIAWLRVDIQGAVTGPTGGDKLTPTKFIQRINTVGGLPPATGCADAADIGNKAFVPYLADYLFYTLETPDR